MWREPFDRLGMAERIADTENRICKLRERADRLREQGGDATQTEELIDVARDILAQLHCRQSYHRRRSWMISR